MKIQLTESQMRQLTEGALKNIFSSGLGIKPIVDIAKGVGHVFGANAAGYRAVQDDQEAGKPISYDDAYKLGKEAYNAGVASTGKWKKAFKKNACDADVIQYLYDEYTRNFFIQNNKANIPIGNDMMQYIMHGQQVNRRMTGSQKDLNKAMFLLKEIADSI